VDELLLPPDDPVAVALVSAIRAGDTAALRALVDEHPGLARARVGTAAESRSPLHLATDWPGHHPEVASIIALLVAGGADVDARFVGDHRETALHWAASNDDIAALDALLDAGADIEADGAVLTGGTPLSDAVVFAQWSAARRLVERGARMTLWQAAALGDLASTEALSEGLPDGDPAITNAAWHASRAGQADTMGLLVDRGADLDIPLHDGLTAREVGNSPLVDEAILEGMEPPGEDR
jgi:ankyrin repeat protein